MKRKAGWKRRMRENRDDKRMRQRKKSEEEECTRKGEDGRLQERIKARVRMGLNDLQTRQTHDVRGMQREQRSN